MNIRYNLLQNNEIETKQQEITNFYNIVLNTIDNNSRYSVFRTLGNEGRRFMLGTSMYGPYKAELVIPHHLIEVCKIPVKLYHI